MKTTLIAFTVAFIVALSIYIFIGLERVWEFTSGNPDMGSTDFKTLKKTPKPNQYLLCPKGYCADTPDTISNTYNMTASKLYDEVYDLVKGNTKRKLLSSDKTRLSLRFLTRSATLRFPDTTNIQIIKFSDTQSTLAVYAQAKLGVSDLGANKIRVDKMIKELEERILIPN